MPAYPRRVCLKSLVVFGRRSLWLSLLLLVVSAVPVPCRAENTATPPGVVATVNGQHITLAQVEACHDISGDLVLLAQTPSLDLLRQQYDSCAVSLVLNALIEQELEQRQLGISESDIDKAETEARADYPNPGDFEKELQEEYLKLETWREFMRHRLASLRFQNQVLRPRFSLSKDDFETYYALNKKRFQKPAQFDLIWFQDTDKARLEQTRAAWKPENAAAPDLSEVATSFRISPDRLSPQLKKDVQSVKFGQPTPIRQEGEVYLFVVPRALVPAKNLSIVEAYPVIEQELIENRMEDASMIWLEHTLKSASIYIAPELRRPEEPEKKLISRDNE